MIRPFLKQLPLILFLAFGAELLAETAEEALWNAIERGDLTEVRAALADGAEPAESSRAFLPFAASRRNVEIVRALLAAKARLDIAGLDLGTVLTAAIGRSGDDPETIAMLHELIAAGAIDAVPDRGLAAVGQAILQGATQSGRLLVEAGAAVEATDPAQPSILHALLIRPIVEESELLPAVQTLLSAGAEISRKDRQGRTPAELAVELGLPEILALFEPGNSTRRNISELRQRALDRSLIVAVARHNSSRIHWDSPKPDQPDSQIEIIRSKIRAGANPHVPLKLWGEWERTALGVLLDGSTAAPTEADPEVLDLLLRHGATWDDLGRNRVRRIREVLAIPGLAEVAVRNGLKTTDPLPAFQISIKGESKEVPSTVLHAAAGGGVVPALQLLLDAGANLETADGAGYTPLACAVAAGKEDATELLLQHGARIDVITTDGLDLADLAARANNRRRVALWDRAGKYRELLESFSPLPGSRWVGQWMLGDPKYASPATLEPDGTARLWAGLAMWTETADGIRLRFARQNRLGLTSTPAEIDLFANAVGGLDSKNINATMYWRLWRPDSPPDPQGEKIQANAEMERKLSAAIDGQFAALESQRSDGFWLDASVRFSGLPDRVWQETRWQRFSVQSGEIGLLPRALSGMANLKTLEIANQSALRIEPGALALPALESLRLRATGIRELPLEWAQLPQLKEVQVFDCRLTSLPSGWRQASCLTWIGVGNGRIRSLPDDLGDAPQLRRLGISSQQLHDLPPSLAGSVIEELYLDSNRFERIPASIRGMRHLRALSLGQNRLSVVISQQLPSDLRTLLLTGNRLQTVPDLSALCSLEQLDLSYNALETLPADPHWLPESVRELNLRGNRLKQMPAWLRQRPFQRLGLDQNAWSNEEARQVSQESEERWRATRTKRVP